MNYGIPFKKICTLLESPEEGKCGTKLDPEG